ncbi:MAG: hypothetical protein RQ751_11425 [Longimicrobiales bacterium]|nr:hypothetical protein [Longimicrobiales bacterium]
MIVNRAVDGIQDHVVPVFRADSDFNSLDHEGSGVLIDFHGRRFLVSAGHAMRACRDGFAIPDDTGQFIWPESPLVLSTPPQGRNDDFLDLGVVELTSREASGFRTERFLDLRPDSLTPTRAWVAPIVVVLGFSVGDTAADAVTSQISGELTQFGTGFLEPENYKRARVDPRYHLLLRLRRESIMTARSVGAPPSWRGLSGAGTWVIPVDEEHQADRPAFAGVLLGRPAHLKKALQVTRVEAVYHFIRLHGPSRHGFSGP